ncbi:MAG: DUF3179 domain-containing protein, partial [Chloroflexi bacterium]|nr:DUF3179 domain-containing protein [Chloroflexota bacterium]
IVACGSSAPSTVDDSSDGDLEQVFADALGSIWDTDFTKHTVDLGEFISGGPAKDGIPALDEPKFDSIADGEEFLVDREPVIALELNGDARAYPLGILTRHEIANDVVGGVPVAVTFCPLCNSAIVFERELEGVVYDFGVSGFLRNSDLVMFDRQTDSWWQQFTGEAIVGELSGALLEVAPSSIVSWADFKATYPDGRVLSRDTGFGFNYGFNPYVGYDSNEAPFFFTGEFDDRLSPIERVVAVELNGEAVAYPFSLLEEERVVHDTVGGESIVVFLQPGTASALAEQNIAEARDVGASGVFLPEAAGRTLTFRADSDGFVDDETGSRWNVLGKAVGGPLAGEELEPIVHGDHFWFAWAAFNPETRVFGE